jgi:hypothetical protein
MVKIIEQVGKARLAASTSFFALLGSQDEFLDPTGYLFIDYLNALRSEVNPRHFRRFARLHGELIKKRRCMFAHEPKVLRKYRWLAKYHNGAIARLRMRRAESLLV